MWQIAGILDAQDKVGNSVLGYPVVGTDDAIASLAEDGVSFLVTIGQIRDAEPRRRACNKVRQSGGRFATIISPLAYVSPSVKVGVGVIVMHRALINASARIGDQCIINSMALIEHDATIGDNCHISTAAVVNGGARIEAGCFIGSNSVVAHGAVVPNNSFVPAGSLHRQSDY